MKTLKSIKNFVVAGVIAAVSVTTAQAQSLPPELSCAANKAFKKCAEIGAKDVTMCSATADTLRKILLTKGVSPAVAIHFGNACEASCLAGSVNLRKAKKNVDEFFPCNE